MSISSSAVRTFARRRQLASMLAPGQRAELQIIAGEGTALTLADGRTVLDAGSMSGAILGHGHPEVVAAISHAARLPYANDHTGMPLRERAAEDLIRTTFAGEPWAEMVTFFVSASEAIDLGLALAQMLTGRKALVARDLGYHGAVGLARGVSAHPGWAAQLVTESGEVTVAPDTTPARLLPVPRCGIAAVDPGHRCADSCLAGASEALSDAAAVVLDMSQGAVVPSVQYQDELARAAAAAGALWLADETVTAFGRTGRSLFVQRGQERPDIVALGKGLTAGAVPGGALVLSKDVVDAIGPRRWMTSSTFRGNALSVAVTSAVQHVIARDGLVERAAVIGSMLGAAVVQVAASHECVESVLGDGLMWIIRLRVPEALREENFRGQRPAVRHPIAIASEAALAAGVFIGELGSGALWLVPPLIILETEILRIVDALDAALTAVDAIRPEASSR